MTWIRLLVAAALLLVAGTATAARPRTGTITGTVTNAAGAVVAAQVTASRKGHSKGAQTRPDGTYELRDLVAGRYDVVATAPGAPAATVKAVKVTAGATVQVNLTVATGGPPQRHFLLEGFHMNGQRSTLRELGAMEIQTAGYGPVKEVHDEEFVDNLPVDVNTAGSAVVGNSVSPDRAPARDGYAHRRDNVFLSPAHDPLSTFGIDVDTASMALVRRHLEEGRRPPPGAVRVEELINYFPYDYPAPTGDAPFSASFEVAACPWNPDARLVRIGLRGRDIPVEKRPDANLVFLVDVSGSMELPDRLPLVKESLRFLVDAVRPRDRVAMVVYAGSSGVALPPTAGSDKARILAAIDRLEAGGSTNGEGGIREAYALARQSFVRGGNNRVVLATDGDFNVGVTDQEQLVRLIAEQAKTGVYLSVLGFGLGNYQDATLELLADKGNGNYAYVDGRAEARKVLSEQLAGTMLTIASDVKIQVELNPARIGAYRLLGYENRLLHARDFNDDRKDAGELGSGHTVTALYEIVPPGPAAQRAVGAPEIDPLRYAATALAPGKTGDLLTVKLRYKAPGTEQSRKLEWALADAPTPAPSADLRFAAGVAAFGMLLRGTEPRADLPMVRRLVTDAVGADRHGHRRAFVALLDRAAALAIGQPPEIRVARAGGGDLALTLSGERLHGTVRGTAVDLQVKPAEIEGKVGGDRVWLWLHGREAEGTVAGQNVGFVVTESPTGYLLRGTSVGTTVRLEQSAGALSFLPGCEGLLLARPRGSAACTVYQGTCASGRKVRVDVPDALERLPVLPRAVLLALLLAEPDEGSATKALFPAEEARR